MFNYPLPPSCIETFCNVINQIPYLPTPPRPFPLFGTSKPSAIQSQKKGRFGGSLIPKVSGDTGPGGGGGHSQGGLDSGDDGEGEGDALWGKDEEQKKEHHEGQVRFFSVNGGVFFFFMGIVVLYF